jgi:hypothetical protein
MLTNLNINKLLSSRDLYFQIYGFLDYRSKINSSLVSKSFFQNSTADKLFQHSIANKLEKKRKELLWQLKWAIHKVCLARYVTSAWSHEQIAACRTHYAEFYARVESTKATFCFYMSLMGGTMGAGLGALLGRLYDKKSLAMRHGAVIGGASTATFLILLTYFVMFKDVLKIIATCDAISNIDRKLDSLRNRDQLKEKAQTEAPACR